jgi:hypothetical protein
MKSHRHSSSVGQAAVLLLAAGLSFACGGRTVRTTAPDPTRVDLSQLWNEPTDLEKRDLFAGPTAGFPAPDTSAPMTFLEADARGFSPGYELRDVKGVTWNVKLGPEAQTEVVSSRILWAIGYHQVPTYYLTTWTMTGGPEGTPGPGRFRPELAGWKAAGDWSWAENDFAHTQPFRGLIVANLMLNNWDWKTSNNRIYEVATAGGQVERRYIVRDLGASLGKTSSPAPLQWLGSRIAQGNRNDLEDFEKQGFITAVEGNRVEFDYDGIYGDIVKTVTPRDIVWTARLLARLSDAQWNDAFRAAGYAPEHAARYVAKLKSKVAEGLALESATSTR